MTREEMIAEIELRKEEERRRKNRRLERFFFASRYPWQRNFISLTAEYPQVGLIAANRVGKTETGLGIDAIHATGDYPDDWTGYRFDFPPLLWLLGYSGEKCRDLLQTPLIGKKLGNEWEGGLIPAERLLGHESMQGVAAALRTLRIKHKSGGISTIQFWSYSQGQHALMGDEVDWFHVDEEPRDPAIWPQVLTRTATGNKNRGGRGILTLTPENGRTQLVIDFSDNPAPGQVLVNAGWDDAPHLTEEVKANLLASYPEHQKDMRTKGVPMLGHGRIYDISEEYVTCEPFAIPDHWRVINGMDFGWDHPQAHLQFVWDTDNDIFYVTKAWKARQTSPAEAWAVAKPWSENVPTSWPSDGLQTEKGSGKQQKSYYEEAGFLMLFEPAQWVDGSRSVEAGLFELLDLMRKGKLKVFRGLRDFFEEFNFYHRDDKGQIVKKRDDLLDALRYAYMMRRYAIPMAHVKSPPSDEPNNYHVPNTMDY
jgi:phage terminase large subunit-like protein